MKIIILVLLTFVIENLFAKIPGVPHELRRHFKSSHKFSVSTQYYLGKKIKIRTRPSSNQVVLIYDLPLNLDYSMAIKKLVLTKLSKDFSVLLSPKSLNDKQKSVYNVYYKNNLIKNSYVKFYITEMKTIAIGLNLPYKGLIPTRFPNALSKSFSLSLINGEMIETKLLKKSLIFPRSSNLPNVTIKEVNAIKNEKAELNKIQIPKGSFPDQIQLDSNGLVWFTQPSQNLLTSYNFIKGSWQHQVVGKGPDGLYIDQIDRIWFGEYSNEHLGVYDIKTKEYKNYKIPYEGSNPAIPFVASNKDIWLTDHANKKVLNFDESNETFEVFDLPTKGAWPVDIREDLATGNLYVSECYANKFGKISTNSMGKHIYEEIELGISGCPAFLTIIDNKIWSGLWTSASFISYDLETKEVTEYKTNEKTGFGPVVHTNDGKIILGGLVSKRVYIFDTKTSKLSYIEGVGNLKDGLTIDKFNTIWLTDTKQYIYRIKLN